MFKTKKTRLLISWVITALFNFVCFWIITDDPTAALKGLLVAYFLFGGLAASIVAINNWIEQGEE